MKISELNWILKSNMDDLLQLNGFEYHGIREEFLKNSDLKEKKDLNGLWLVHTTNFWFNDGFIKPRTSIEFGKTSLSQDQEFLLGKGLEITRSTVHFCLNGIAEAHEKNLKTISNSIVILEPFSNEDVRSQIIAGYIEDFFCFGPYKVSKNAVILIEESKYEAIKDQINKDQFKELIVFKDSSENAVKEFFEKNKINKIEYFKSSNLREDLAKIYCFAKLGEEFIDSKKICEILKVKFQLHSNSIFAIIDMMLTESYQSIVNSINFKNKVYDIINYLEELSKEIYILNETQTKCLIVWPKALKELLSLNFQNPTNNKYILSLEEVRQNKKAINTDCLIYDDALCFNAQEKYPYLLQTLKKNCKTENVSFK